jgi:protein-tyrosine phosphatase
MRRGPARLVPLEGAFNFRDLGGYPVLGGGRTRWGRLYRSDGLQALTEADAAALRELGLSTVVDLRTDVELERWGRGRLRDEPIRWEHLSVIRADGGESVAAPDTDDLAERYLWYLEVGAGPVARALAVLAEPGATPAVFHCAAGKDRTGVVAALILDAVGVEPEAIVTDYAETSAHLGPILERLGANPPTGQVPVPPSRLTVEPATMERFLERLQQRHGGAAKWMVAASGDASLPERLAELLVER